jgi:hypothetical protein
MMNDIGLGDVLFILLILGVIHGIMRWVTCLRARKRNLDVDSTES